MSSSTAGNGQLQGLRVFVVEDEALIALMLEDLLAAFGCGVVGPLARLAAAQRAAQSRDFDCAILDVNINGEPVYPVAEILSERGIPFIFVTGYAKSGVGRRLTGRPDFRHSFKPREPR